MCANQVKIQVSKESTGGIPIWIIIISILIGLLILALVIFALWKVIQRFSTFSTLGSYASGQISFILSFFAFTDGLLQEKIQGLF